MVPKVFEPLYKIKLTLTVSNGIPFKGEKNSASSGNQTQDLQPGLEVITKFSCSTQLSMKFYLLINSKLLRSTLVFLLNLAEFENFSAYEYENANIS